MVEHDGQYGCLGHEGRLLSDLRAAAANRRATRVRLAVAIGRCTAQQTHRETTDQQGTTDQQA
ncbi:hypothetical protein, partial [Xanthomonas oryzae]